MISRALRFDDYSSRRQQRSHDKFAPIRTIWDKWVESLPTFYNPHDNVTIDEQLLSFRGRCKFRQYMPSKPAKYGIKLWVLVDSSSKYVWNIQPYLGKAVSGVVEKQQGKRVVLDLVKGLNGHNITVDNFFTSLELSQELLKQKLTIVGTLRLNKKCIPPKLLQCKHFPLFSSSFAFSKDTTLVSYISRKNKCTVLLSTLHHQDNVNHEHAKKLPEIVEYYNYTKGIFISIIIK